MKSLLFESLVSKAVNGPWPAGMSGIAMTVWPHPPERRTPNAERPLYY